MITITEAGKNKDYRYQIVLDANTSYSTKYLLCDDCKTRITRYILGRTGNMALFASEVGKLDSVVCMHQDEVRKFIDVFDIADPGDLSSYVHRMAIANLCGAIEFNSFNYIPSAYSTELDSALGQIPVEEIVVDTNSYSFRERALRRH